MKRLVYPTVLVLAALLSVCWSSSHYSPLGGTSSLPSTLSRIAIAKDHRHSIDLSGRHGVPHYVLTDIIEGFLEKALETENGDNVTDAQDVTIEVDVSHSALRDDGFAQIVKVLFPIAMDNVTGTVDSTTKVKHPVSFHLICRMNHLSPGGITKLFHRLLLERRQKQPGATGIGNETVSAEGNTNRTLTKEHEAAQFSESANT